MLITFGMAQLSSPLDGKEGDALRAMDQLYIYIYIFYLAIQGPNSGIALSRL